MKTLFATAFFLTASSFVAAHAEWEILELPTAATTQVASTTPATTMTATTPPQGPTTAK